MSPPSALPDYLGSLRLKRLPRCHRILVQSLDLMLEFVALVVELAL